MTMDDLADHLAATNGTVAELRQHVHDLTTRLDAPRLAQALLPDLELPDQITCLMQSERAAQWCTDAALRCLAEAWDNARWRALLCTAARKCGFTPGLLEGMVQQWRGEQACSAAGLTTMNGLALLQSADVARQDVISDVLPAGCTLLAGNAKDGKSLLAYHLAACVATGKPFLGQFPVTAGEVLFFALEDGQRRGKERLEKQRDQLNLPAEPFRNLHFRFWDAPRLGSGFEPFLEQWIATHPETRLVVIDILEKIRPRGGFWHDLYQQGYEATAPLARLAQERNIALLVVHHTNKNPHADPRLLVSGPMSLLGGADNAWLLRRPYGETDAELIISGRDVPEQEFALHFAEGLWTLEGTVQECRMSKARREVLEILHEERLALRPHQLAQAMGKRQDSLRSLLRKMRDDGQVLLQEDGTYLPLVDPPSVHGVHDISTPIDRARDPCTAPDHADDADTGEHADHSGHGDHAAHGIHTEHAMHGDHGVHVDHTMHGDHAMHTGNGVHADDGDHADYPDHVMHAVHGDDAGHADHVMHAGHDRHAVHAPPEEPDPFLEPDDCPGSASRGAVDPAPLGEPRIEPPARRPGQACPGESQGAGSAQVSTTAHVRTAPQLGSPRDEGPLQAKEWIWPCLPSGAKTSVSPWEVLEILTLPNGTQFASCLTATGKVNRWPLAQCQRAPTPEDLR